MAHPAPHNPQKPHALAGPLGRPFPVPSHGRTDFAAPAGGGAPREPHTTRERAVVAAGVAVPCAVRRCAHFLWFTRLNSTKVRRRANACAPVRLIFFFGLNICCFGSWRASLFMQVCLCKLRPPDIFHDRKYSFCCSCSATTRCVAASCAHLPPGRRYSRAVQMRVCSFPRVRLGPSVDV